MVNSKSRIIVNCKMLEFFVKESLGIQLEVRKDILGEENMDSSDEAIRVALLADLQQIQDGEAQNMITIFESKVTNRMSKVSQKTF